MKRFLCTLLSMTMILFLFVEPASAESRQATTVSCSVAAKYIVNIPAFVEITGDYACCDITASEVNIGTDKNLVVEFDLSQTYVDGCFFLYTIPETRNGDSIECKLYVSSLEEDAAQNQVDQDYNAAACFSNGETTPNYQGRIWFYPQKEFSSPGNYSGTVYFKIYVQ